VGIPDGEGLLSPYEILTLLERAPVAFYAGGSVRDRRTRVMTAPEVLVHASMFIASLLFCYALDASIR